MATAAFAAGVDDYVRKEETLAHYQILARRIRHAVEKRRADDALKESESVLHSFFDRPGVMRGIVEIIDGSTVRHVMDNKVSANFLGLTPEAMCNKTSTELGELPKIIKMWISHYNESRRTGKPVEFEYADERGDTATWLSVTVNFLGDNSDGVPRYAYTIIDNTERRKAVEETTRLASFPQLNPNPILEADLTGKIHYTNPAANADFPELSRMGTTSPLALNWAETVTKLQGKDRKAVTKEAEINRVWYELSLHLVPNTDRVRIYMRDVDQRKRAEEELQERERQLTAILTGSPIPMFVVDSEVVVTQVNPSVESFTGREAGQLIGLRAGEAIRCLHSLDDPDGCGYGPSCKTCRVRGSVNETLNEGREIHQAEAELHLINDGGEKTVNVLVSTIPVNISGETKVLVCIEDVTKLKEKEVELEKANFELQANHEELQQSSEEIKAINEELRETNEYLGAAEEELRASNEELQSKNEELQATEEELRVSNEQLQQLNQRLDATNEELKSSEEDLQKYNATLESMVAERTREISLAKDRLETASLYNRSLTRGKS